MNLVAGLASLIGGSAFSNCDSSNSNAFESGRVSTAVYIGFSPVSSVLESVAAEVAISKPKQSEGSNVQVSVSKWEWQLQG